MIIENKDDAIAALNFIEGKINQMNKVLEVVVAEPTTRVMISKLMEYLANTERVVYCKEREWIDTEEEMPIDGEEVLVSVYWTDYGDTILAYGHYNARVDNWKLYSDSEGELIKGYEVVAWMPMPYPYKEVTE